MNVSERIVIDDDDRFGRLTVERVTALPPKLQLMPVFVPVGAGRDEWERARAAEVEYIRPTAARASDARH